MPSQGEDSSNSTLFAEILSERHARRLSKKADNAGIKIRWRVELTSGGTEEHPAGQLTLLPLDEMGRPTSRGVGMILNENGRIPTQLFTYYEAVLYAFYNYPIRFPERNIESVLTFTVGILHVAEYLGCMPLIVKSIEVALLQHGQELYSHIQQQPWNWVQMARRIESETIFKEAIIHLSGNWTVYGKNPDIVQALRNVPGTQELCQKYHDQLEKRREKLELAIISQYPGNLATPCPDRPIRREEYAKYILVWMALCFFRHWLGQRLILQKAGRGEDGGYVLYSQLSCAGDSYMDRSILNQLHLKFPLTKKAMKVIENHLLEIKECMKCIVDSHGILKNESQLTAPVKYLRCVDVRREDVPWLVETDEVVFQGRAGLNGWRPGGNDIIWLNLSASRRLAQVGEAVPVDEEVPSRKRAYDAV